MPAPVDLLKPGTWPRWVQFAVPIGAAALLALLFFYPSASAPVMRSLLATSDSVAADPAVVRARLERNLLHGTGDTEDLQVTVQNTGKAPLTNLQVQVVAPGFALQRNDSMPVHDSGFPEPPDALAIGAEYTFHVRVQPAARSGSYGITAMVNWRRAAAAPAADTKSSPEGGEPAPTLGTDPKASSGGRERAMSEAAGGGRTLFLGPVLFDGSFGSARFGRLGQRLASAIKDLTLPLLLLLLTNYFARRQDDKDEADRSAQAERAEKQQVRQLLLGRVMEYAERAYLPMMSAASGAVDEGDALCRNNGGDPLRVVYFLLKLHLSSERQRKSNAGVFLQSREAERMVQASLLVSRVAVRAVLTAGELRAASRRGDLLEDFETFRTGGSAVFQPAATRVQAWIRQENTSAFTQHGDIAGFLGALDALQAVLRYETNRPFMKYWYDDPAVWEFRLAKSILPEDRHVPPTNVNYLQTLRRTLQTHCQREL